MEDSIISLMNEAAGIKKYVTPLTYRTILGQIRSGNLAGAAKGIRKIQRRHANDKARVVHMEHSGSDAD